MPSCWKLDVEMEVRLFQFCVAKNISQCMLVIVAAKHLKGLQTKSFPLQCQVATGAGVRSNDIQTLTNRDLCIGGVDFVTLIFTLSAVPQDKMLIAIRGCFNALKPGGLIFFRDYGLYDMTMLRFDSSQKVGAREYMRSDGTLSYFFCLDTVRKLFTDAGFKELELEYCCVNSVNRRKGKSMRRVWVHGKFQKTH
ncbi:unnamed protein product [Rhodiola kirilowii]